jgi:hypothetical protein
MKRSSYSATARTHWEELAAAFSLRPISTYGLHAACAGGGDPAGGARLECTPGQRSVASMPAGRRPFEAHRNTAKLEVERRDSAARVRSSRSGALESALSMHAAPDAVGSSAYSRRQR